METSKERVLKAVDHIQPETVPINIEGIYADLQPWYDYFEVDNKLDLRSKLGVDLQCARPVYTGAGIDPDCTIFQTPADVYGAAGVGFGKGRHYPLQGAQTVHDIENFAWPDPDEFDYAVAAKVLQSIPADTAKRVEGKYALLTPGMTLEEATQKSGSLITARLAAEQGREVFAVPGSIHSFKSSGTHALIKQGAKLVEHVQDIMEELLYMMEEPVAKVNFIQNQTAPVLPALSPDESLVIGAIDPYPIHIDDLARTLSMGPGKLSSILLRLELKGMITQSPGKFFSLREQI